MVSRQDSSCLLIRVAFVGNSSTTWVFLPLLSLSLVVAFDADSDATVVHRGRAAMVKNHAPTYVYLLYTDSPMFVSIHTETGSFI
jgi:hypothetical protein